MALNIKIERRPLPKKEFKIEQPVPQNNLRPATEEELYNAGFIVHVVSEHGRECIWKQGEVVACYEDLGLIE